MPKKLAVIKVGSSSLTMPDGRIYISYMGRVCEEIHKAYDAGWNIILVSSGAMAAGVAKAGEKDSLVEKDRGILAAIGQPLLMRYYIDFFGVHGMIPAQCLLTEKDIDSDQERMITKITIQKLLDNKFIPIINENDFVLDNNRTGDNDLLSAKISVLMNADKLLIVSDVDGLYTSNPFTDPNAEHIDCVGEITEETYKCVGASHTENSKGGMKSKLDAASLATANGTDMILFKGSIGMGNISRILLEDATVGTLFTKQ